MADPTATVFVDDRLQNLTPAAALGDEDDFVSECRSSCGADLTVAGLVM